MPRTSLSNRDANVLERAIVPTGRGGVVFTRARSVSASSVPFPLGYVNDGRLSLGGDEYATARSEEGWWWCTATEIIRRRGNRTRRVTCSSINIALIKRFPFHVRCVVTVVVVDHGNRTTSLLNAHSIPFKRGPGERRFVV